MEAVTIFSQHSCSDKFSQKHLSVKGLRNTEIIIAMKKAHKQIKNNKNAKQMHYNIHVYGLNYFFFKKTSQILWNSWAVFKSDNNNFFPIIWSYWSTN